MRPDVAARKIARAEAWLTSASRLLAVDARAFATDVEHRDLAAFYLLLTVQECLDLASHWIADAGWPAAEDSAGCFDILAGSAGRRPGAPRIPGGRGRSSAAPKLIPDTRGQRQHPPAAPGVP